MQATSSTLPLLLVLVVLVGDAVSQDQKKKFTCEPDVGLQVPPPACTPTDPCKNLLNYYTDVLDIHEIDEPETAPKQCSIGGGNLGCDGPPMKVNVPGNPTGVGVPSQRSYCSFVPSSATTDTPVPLVIHFPGSSGWATEGYGFGWRAAAESGVAGAFGGKSFAFVDTQPLNRHWPVSGAIGSGEDGSKNDFFYRTNFAANDDVRYVDTIIDRFVATGVIDPSRIYVTGYSNGALFANMYGSIRRMNPLPARGSPNGATPGGNGIAASAVFSGASPWVLPTDCTLRPTPSSPLPAMTVSYLCDIDPCDWYLGMAETMLKNGSIATKTVLLNDDQSVASHSKCIANIPDCTDAKRNKNHETFPSAMLPEMAAFMSTYTLNVSEVAAAPSSLNVSDVAHAPGAHVCSGAGTRGIGTAIALLMVVLAVLTL